MAILSRQIGVPLEDKRFHSKSIQIRIDSKDVILLCPTTFMNLSGISIRNCADFYGLNAEDILIIHDDLDLPIGKIKIVKNGGAGGHRGILSIIEQLGNVNFARIKIGIGRPRMGEPIEEYVLSSFYEDEKGTMEKVILLAANACRLFIVEGIESTMNKVNCQNLAGQEIED
jgi:PTH1 family peptidyl-tRNA hydrolase